MADRCPYTGLKLRKPNAGERMLYIEDRRRRTKKEMENANATKRQKDCMDKYGIKYSLSISKHDAYKLIKDSVKNDSNKTVILSGDDK